MKKFHVIMGGFIWKAGTHIGETFHILMLHRRGAINELWTPLFCVPSSSLVLDDGLRHFGVLRPGLCERPHLEDGAPRGRAVPHLLHLDDGRGRGVRLRGGPGPLLRRDDEGFGGLPRGGRRRGGGATAAARLLADDLLQVRSHRAHRRGHLMGWKRV